MAISVCNTDEEHVYMAARTFIGFSCAKHPTDIMQLHDSQPPTVQAKQQPSPSVQDVHLHLLGKQKDANALYKAVANYLRCTTVATIVC